MKENKAPSNSAAHGGIQVDHGRQIARLSRIEGQVRGVAKMIETKRDCLDVLNQISAIVNGLRRVQNDMLGDHLAAIGEAIITETVTPKRRREMAEEIASLLKQIC